MATLSRSLSELVACLDTYPQMRNALVFGSLLDRPDTARDIDVGFVSDKPASAGFLHRLSPLLAQANRRTSHYGQLDVFAVFPDTVYVRNEECSGFAKAKFAAKFRATIQEKGVPWSVWRQGVSLDPQVPSAPPLPEMIYFAHPQNSYNTPIEDRAIHALVRVGFEVCNPNKPDHRAHCGKDMNKWAALAQSCGGVAMLAFEDGAIGAGVAMEADAAKAQGKPVYLIDRKTLAIHPCPTWPEGFRVLSVEQTRAILRPDLPLPSAPGYKAPRP